MSWGWMLAFYVGGLAVLIGIGCPIAIALGLVALSGILLLNGWALLPTVGDIIWNTGNSFTLGAIPMFILLGEVIVQTGLSQRFYRGLSLLLGRISGGLLYANIVSCAVFSAISGSSVATGLTMGQVALPELRKRGYDLKLSVGSLAGGGTLGILIPPSIPMIVYGVTVQASIIDLFMAGVVPGLLLSALFMVWIKISLLLNSKLAPPPVLIKQSTREIGLALLDCLSFGILIAAVLGSLYSGLVTPTEAGAFGALASILISMAYGELNLKRIFSALRNTVSICTVVYYIIVSAMLLSFSVTNAGIARGLSNMIVEAQVTPLQFFMVLTVLYVILGMFIEGISMMLLTVPVLLPSIIAAGFDLVWFGVILVIFIEIAALTPPVGLNLFAICSVTPDLDLKLVIRGSFPFLCIMFVILALFYMFPEIVLWLPHTMY